MLTFLARFSVLSILFLYVQSVNADTINNSLLLDSSQQDYLSHTPAQAGDRTTWTWSGWIKRWQLGNSGAVFSSASLADIINFPSENGITFAIGNTTGSITTNHLSSAPALFRDVSDWMHVVAVWDSNNLNSTDRMRLYVNGVRITNFSLETYPSQGAQSGINNTIVHAIGRRESTSSLYYSGYLSDIHFIDGQALDATAFGEFNGDGIWAPKPYGGTYGDNGFYLEFTDDTNLGDDTSGNNNNWVSHNINSENQVFDTPTNNFCTWNALTPSSFLTQGSVNITDGALRVEDVATSYGVFSRGTFSLSSGKWYWEIKTEYVGGGYGAIGIGAENASDGYNSYVYTSDGEKATDIYGSGTSYGSPHSNGDIVGVALDMDAGTIEFYLNGVSLGEAFSGISGSYVPIVGDGQNTTTYSYVANFGQRPFVYIPPTGYKSLSTSNLEALAIKNPKSYFNVLTYTGNGSSNVITGAGFQPDLVWVKRRDAASGHVLMDSVRGINAGLWSNSDSLEYNEGLGVDSFDADGFTVNDTSSTWNENGGNYVSWLLKKGATPGFDIQNFIGNGATQDVSHSLGVEPELMIIKSRTVDNTHWCVYNKSIGPDKRVMLDISNAAAQTQNWNSTLPGANTFSVGVSGEVNASGQQHVAYLFSSVPGFSKVFNYTGNGSTDGPFIHLGFKPAFWLIKRTDAAGNWRIYDTKRNPLNLQVQKQLYANLTNAEVNANGDFDSVSNGLKSRSNVAETNATGGAYIGIAFAEQSFGSRIVDQIAPVLTESHPIANITPDSTPEYGFHSTEAGTVLMTGSCSTNATSAQEGENTIVMNPLVAATYSDCAITVTDSYGNASEPLQISSFTIDPAQPYTPPYFADFDGSNGDYLNWTPSVAGDQSKWTWSSWVRRGTLGTINTLLYVDGDGQDAYVRFNASNELEIALGDGSHFTYQSVKFSSSTIWMNLVLSVDTSQANSNDRVKVFLDGTQLSPEAGFVAPSQNSLTLVNSTYTHYLGNGAGADYFDGAMADVHLVDGLSLNPADFGEQTSQGVWIPTSYSSGGGANSSYLKFNISTNLGSDSTGNNDWQVVGLELPGTSVYSGKIKRILAGTSLGDKALIVVEDKNQVASPASCSTDATYSYIFDTSTIAGRNTFTLLVTAYMTGRNVTMEGTGECLLHPLNKVEGLSYLLLRE